MEGRIGMEDGRIRMEADPMTVWQEAHRVGVRLNRLGLRIHHIDCLLGSPTTSLVGADTAIKHRLHLYRRDLRHLRVRLDRLRLRIHEIDRILGSPSTPRAWSLVRAERALRHRLLHYRRNLRHLRHLRHIRRSAPRPIRPSITAPDSAADRRGQHLPMATSSDPAPTTRSDELVIHIKDQVPRKAWSEIPIGLRLGSVLERKKKRMIKRKRKMRHPRTSSYFLSPQTTIGELKAQLRRRHQPGWEFLLLQPHEDGYPSSLYNPSKSLAEYGVKDGETLRMSSCHRFPLHICNSSPYHPDHPFPVRHHTISPLNPKMIVLHPSIYDTVATLKELIYLSTKYPPHTQLLDHGFRKIHHEDDRTLQSLGFNCRPGQFSLNQVTLVCSLTQPPPLAIPPWFISITIAPDFHHLSTTFPLDPNTTIGRLRNSHLLVDNSYTFRLGTTVLEDAKTLVDYNVRDGDVIHLCQAIPRSCAGLIIPQLNDGKIRVDMGQPVLTPSDIPTKLPANKDGTVVRAEMVVDGVAWNVTCLSMGSPHCVTFGTEKSEDLHVDDIKLGEVGPLFENHEMFPSRTNTEFVQVLSPSHLKMRVWERGAGVTLACGTGACAVVVAAVLEGRAERKCIVDQPGGPLEIEWQEANNHVFMTGPAEIVFSGSVSL